MASPLWQQAAKVQKAKDWIDGDLRVFQDAISFKGGEDIQIMISALTGVQYTDT